MEKRGQGAWRPLQWLVATALLLASSSALALGLGQIRVLSGPGQPLLAEIPIISNQPGELENARVRLASAETFARVGLQPPTGLVRDLQFAISADAHGRAVVRVTSSAPVDVPAVSFLVEVDWGQGRLVREYSALVEAPQSAVAIEAPVIEAPQALPSDMIVRAPEPLPPPPPAPVEPAPAPAPARAPAAAIQPTVAAAPGETLARVERGQTLSHVVAAMDRGGYSREQAMVALLRANPEAFIGGNIHRVRAGAVLRMPGAEHYADAATAAALVREQTAQWRQLAQPVPQPAVAGAPEQQGTIGDSAAAAPAPAAAAAAAGARLEIAPAVAAEGTQAATSGLGSGGEGDMLANEQLRQAQEDLAARESEVQELRSRVEELEKLQQQQMKLIELKDSELAAAQQRLAQMEQESAHSGLGLWPLVLLLLAAAAGAAWWFARRPKPLPIPVGRGAGFDAAALAAAAPSTHVPADPVVPVEAPELEPHPVEPEAYVDEQAPEPDVEPELPLRHDDLPPPAPAARESAAPAWHDDASAFTTLNPAPAGRERLELAVAYLDLGDVDTARTLLREVLAGQDPAARDEAAQLLREIG
ncbi:FimV/HubP family polar landmark protein [Pseudoxanthomonas sp. SGT-18]|uniref:FimV/HubP family polar landmark protein n=1 Tax=Pseudoxanthomonas sp. SGT-18 TaxID=2493087 RepID=UPI000F628C81|nr:FimV/HubP family polar landmark protein [Pseudoxanthomonas sp. SGT-18]